MLEKALSLLKPHAKYFGNDYYWHFRKGYAYFYLNQKDQAYVILKKLWRFVPMTKILRIWSIGVKTRKKIP